MSNPEHIDMDTFRDSMAEEMQKRFFDDYEQAMEYAAEFETECNWDDYKTTKEAIEDAIRYVICAME